MSDYYSREELKDMPAGTTLGDEHGDLWVKGIQGKWVHDSGSGLVGCTAPPLLKNEPTEPSLSDEQDDQAHGHHQDTTRRTEPLRAAPEDEAPNWEE